MPNDTTPTPAAPSQLGAESLDDLAREAGAAAAEAQPEATAEPQVMTLAPSDGLRFGCRALAGVVGGIVCGRAGVSPLTPGELDSLGAALAGVAVYYLPTDGDPRFMAWMTLALAVGAVAAPRVREAREADATQPQQA